VRCREGRKGGRGGREGREEGRGGREGGREEGKLHMNHTTWITETV